MILRSILAVLGFVAFSAQAGVIQIGSQAAFSASGTIVQNTNWDSYGAGFVNPGSPFTIGDLTFVEGGENLIGGFGTTYDLARNLFTDNFVAGTTALTANTYDLLGFNAGNFYGDDFATFVFTTNLGTYSFTEFVTSAVNQAPLTFFGYRADPGEYFVSMAWTGANATGITDVQLGTTGVPIPAPSSLALFGLALLALMAMRRIRQA